MLRVQNKLETTMILGELLKAATTKSATLKNAEAGFRDSGLVPRNPDVIPKHEHLEDPRKSPPGVQCDESSKFAYLCHLIR